MLRAAGAAAVIIASTAIGYGMGRELSNRIRSLRELGRVADILKAEIQYAGTPLQEIFREIAKRTTGSFAAMFRDVADKMEQRDGKTLGTIFKECIQELPAETGLTGNDKMQLEGLGTRLGYLDSRMQIQTIERFKEELKREQEEAEGDYRQKVRVYRCLGFLGGVFLTLLLL
ncbi:MAG: stage III sporulation protein AB [Eubacteriales bacterium]|nr:stage III sporulation protein AB [Eubacteriales bacterium]